MGLSAVQFVVGHFLTAMAFYFVETATVITFMYAIKVGWNHVPYAYGIDPGMVFISFLLFDVGQALIPVYVTSVCPRGEVHIPANLYAYSQTCTTFLSHKRFVRADASQW